MTRASYLVLWLSGCLAIGATLAISVDSTDSPSTVDATSPISVDATLTDSTIAPEAIIPATSTALTGSTSSTNVARPSSTDPAEDPYPTTTLGNSTDPTTNSTTPSSPRSNSTDATMISTAWYAGWHSDILPLANVSWEKYTQLTYAFAETTEDVHNLSLENSNPELLPLFVEAAHDHNVKACVSIGGWSGSRFFSNWVATPENRTAFVKTVADFAQNNSLDCVDFDWENPNNEGIGCNAYSPDDTANFLLFLQELRANPVGADLTISAATLILPFRGTDGEPSSDLAGFAKVLDYIAIMAYDIWGSWSESVGPNAPLDDSCAPPDKDHDSDDSTVINATTSKRQGSATGAVRLWMDAGMPASQIVLGVPAYGHSFRVPRADAISGSGKKLSSYPPFDKTSPPAGDSKDSQGGGEDVCGVVQAGAGGVVNFWGMTEMGYLDVDGRHLKHSNGSIVYRFDRCSHTPFVYDNETEVMVSYDDGRSMMAKGKFVKEHGLGGFAMWEAAGDYHDILLDSIRCGTGL